MYLHLHLLLMCVLDLYMPTRAVYSSFNLLIVWSHLPLQSSAMALSRYPLSFSYFLTAMPYLPWQGLADASDRAWRIAAVESVLRCMCERGRDVHKDDCTRDIACFRWDGSAEELGGALGSWQDNQASTMCPHQFC